LLDGFWAACRKEDEDRLRKIEKGEATMTKRRRRRRKRRRPPPMYPSIPSPASSFPTRVGPAVCEDLLGRL
jgi:hypothetical protein